MNIVEELRQQEKEGFFDSKNHNNSGSSQTNQQKSEEFSSENTKYRQYFDNIHDAIYILDKMGTIIEMNETAYQRLGYEKNELLGKSISDIDTKEYQKKGYNALKSLQDKKSVTLEIAHITKHGKKIPVEISASVINDHEIIAIARDITNKKNELERYKSFFSSSKNALMTLTPPSWKFTSANQATLDIFKVSSEQEFIKLGPGDVSPEFQSDGSLSTDKAKRMINKAIENGTCYFEWTHQRIDGEKFPATILLTRIDINGEKIIQATVRDLTLEKRYNKELKENERRLERIFENLPTGIITIDAKTHKILEVNKNASHLIGLPKNQIVGNVCHDFICPAEQGQCPITDLHEQVDKDEKILIDKDKKKVKILKNVLPIKLQGKDVLLESFVDITELDKARYIINKSKKQNEGLLNAAADGIRIINKKFQVVDLNDTMANIVGKSKKDLIGSHCWETFGSNLCKTEKCPMNKVLQSGKGYKLQTIRKTPNGKEIHCIMKVTPLLDENNQITGIIEDYQDITQIIKKEKKIEEKNKQLLKTSARLEYLMKDMQKTLNEFNQIFNNRSNAMIVLDNNFRILRMNNLFLNTFNIDKSRVLGMKYSEAFDFPHCNQKNPGKTCQLEQQLKEENRVNIEEEYNGKYFSITGSMIYSEKNEIQGYVISYVDISKMKEQNKKLKKLDELKSNFLNVTSHELRTPMSSIKGYVQMMLKKVLGDISEEQSKALNVILRNTNRLDNLIQDILDISRLESGSMKFISEETNIRKMIEEIHETMSQTAAIKQIKLEIQMEDDLPNIVIDQYRIKQVIMNLINNSIKFSPEHTTITIRVHTEHEKTIVEVSDQGRGIPKEKQKHVFDTFYQVDGGRDRKFGGAGLGLAISRGIVLTHGGDIWVDSTGVPGKGTTFSFSIPNDSVKDLEERFKELDVFRLDDSK